MMNTWGWGRGALRRPAASRRSCHRSSSAHRSTLRRRRRVRGSACGRAHELPSHFHVFSRPFSAVWTHGHPCVVFLFIAGDPHGRPRVPRAADPRPMVLARLRSEDEVGRGAAVGVGASSQVSPPRSSCSQHPPSAEWPARSQIVAVWFRPPPPSAASQHVVARSIVNAENGVPDRSYCLHLSPGRFWQPWKPRSSPATWAARGLGLATGS